MLDKVEGLGHVHHAHKNFRPISDEVVDRLHNHPGAHCSGDTSLVGELQIVNNNKTVKLGYNRFRYLIFLHAYRFSSGSSYVVNYHQESVHSIDILDNERVSKIFKNVENILLLKKDVVAV